MKKVLPVLALLLAFTVFACVVISTPSTVLYLLNWGEYIDDSIVARFEQKFNCQVVMETVTSSEAMYQKITAGTSPYDVAVPGDYTVRQLYKEGYLREFDVNNVQYPNLASYETLFVDQLRSIMAANMVDETSGEEINTYYFPYFYGAYSIIYGDYKADVPSVVTQEGFHALYDRSLYQESVGIGMYNSARWLVSSAMMANGRNPNATTLDGSTEGDISPELKADLIAQIKAARFDVFGDDDLKRSVANGSLDMCYTQSGDFFDALSLVYAQSAAGTKIRFNVSVPKLTAAFFDSLVIPTTCQNYGLANAFVNFMMDVDNAYPNACAIGYSPTLKSVVAHYIEEAEKGVYYYGDETSAMSLKLKDFLELYPVYLNPLGGCETVYMLEPKSNAYLTTCETIFNSLAIS